MFISTGIVRFIIGPDDQRFADGERFIIRARPSARNDRPRRGAGFRTTQAITVVTAVIVVALLFWFLNRTRTGKAMRAFPTTRIWRCCRASTPNGWWSSPG
jgi:branched-chain amino acid transport system permease protein